MRTGLEHTTPQALESLVNNLKSGTFLAIEKIDSAAFELDMTLLQIFEAEFLRRDMDFDGFIGDKLRTIIDNWLEVRE
ncbi:hypothetical protein SEA_BEUFFERT_217 [Streptomyces phage Beuffert]|nr:hypothetical protein SEA_BEUFFERT_217 [Streptomyces phage Beuffert]